MAKSFKIQGYNFVGFGEHVYGTKTAKNELDLIAEGGANAIAIVTEYYQNDIHSNTLFTNSITPTDGDLIAGIKAAQARNLNVMLKPHVDALDGNWRATFDPTNPDQWFASYKSMMVHYAEIAEQTGVRTLSIGCELRSMTGAQYKSEWLDIIEAVRTVYDGKLTYAATFDEASTVSFWKQLDSIGIDGYFPLAVADKTPTVAELKYAWTHASANDFTNQQLHGKSPIDYLHDLSKQYGKHVEFTEIGYRSIDTSAIDPGNFGGGGKVDEKLQANLYKAMFDTFASQGGDWFDGFYLWERRAEGQTNATDFHTKGRPAQTVIDKWFGMDNRHQPAPDTGMAVYGTVGSDRLVAGVGGTQLLGSDGNDTLIGGEGKDVLIGGLSQKHAGGQSMISLGAYGDMLEGTGAKFTVLVNGRSVGKGEALGGHAESWDLSQFAFRFDTPKAFDSIKVVFINDDAAGGHDRNLYVTSIAINGLAIDLADASNSQSQHSGTLYAAGAFSVDLQNESKALMPASTDRDILDGGLGRDRLTGGADADTFGFATGYGRDEITDFGGGDKAYLANWKAIDNFSQLKSHAENHGDNLWITAGKDILIIDDFQKTDLQAGDFQF